MRSFKSGFTRKQLKSIQRATMNFKYRNIPCLKNPLDLVIYTKLIWDIKPATIFEFGSKAGGSSLFFSDICNNYNLNTEIISIDLFPPNDHPSSMVTFLEGNVLEIEKVFARHSLYDQPHPWLVIDDSAHSYNACTTLLHFFAKHLLRGEYLIIEDGILDELGLSKKYEGGPNRAIKNFFRKNPDKFHIADDYCDMFGKNLTYNPNGYLRKI